MRKIKKGKKTSNYLIPVKNKADWFQIPCSGSFLLKNNYKYHLFDFLGFPFATMALTEDPEVYQRLRNLESKIRDITSNFHLDGLMVRSKVVNFNKCLIFLMWSK